MNDEETNTQDDSVVTIDPLGDGHRVWALSCVQRIEWACCLKWLGFYERTA